MRRTLSGLTWLLSRTKRAEEASQLPTTSTLPTTRTASSISRLSLSMPPAIQELILPFMLTLSTRPLPRLLLRSRLHLTLTLSSLNGRLTRIRPIPPSSHSTEARRRTASIQRFSTASITSTTSTEMPSPALLTSTSSLLSTPQATRARCQRLFPLFSRRTRKLRR